MYFRTDFTFHQAIFVWIFRMTAFLDVSTAAVLNEEVLKNIRDWTLSKSQNCPTSKGRRKSIIVRGVWVFVLFFLSAWQTFIELQLGTKARGVIKAMVLRCRTTFHNFPSSAVRVISSIPGNSLLCRTVCSHVL